MPLMVREPPPWATRHGATLVLSSGSHMAVRWQTGVRHQLRENKGEHTAAPAACARFTPEDAAKARRHARISICREITMPIPHVTDRIKEAPAVALRAVFAGIGQLLMAG